MLAEALIVGGAVGGGLLLAKPKAQPTSPSVPAPLEVVTTPPARAPGSLTGEGRYIDGIGNAIRGTGLPFSGAVAGAVDALAATGLDKSLDANRTIILALEAMFRTNREVHNNPAQVQLYRSLTGREPPAYSPPPPPKPISPTVGNFILGSAFGSIQEMLLRQQRQAQAAAQPTAPPPAPVVNVPSLPIPIPIPPPQIFNPTPAPISVVVGGLRLW